MLYNVASLLKAPAGADLRQTIDGAVALESDGSDGSGEARIVGPVTGEVRFQRANQGILATGTFHARLELQCGRCLTHFEQDLDAAFSDMFYPTIDVVTGTPMPTVDHEPGFVIDARHHLDLSESIRQQIILDLPMSPICRADCAGLCPICGGNRNVTPCDCEEREDAAHNPFARLINLQLPEDA